MDTRSQKHSVRKHSKVRQVKKKKSRGLGRHKEQKLVWMKAPVSFNQEKLRATVRAHVARQKKLKAEIMSGKFNVRFGTQAA